MSDFIVYTLDLNFQGHPKTIAAYLIPHARGAVLVETGPGSTVEALETNLNEHGFAANQITDVLLTHIHLDHAGAAGWLARQGARIHVHHRGARHMHNPERLLASATRIYGEQMENLWGELLSVPLENLVALYDEDEIVIEGLRFIALDTPGHATHHLVYLIEDICFTGDIGGVRLPGPLHIRLPMPPPEFHLEYWQKSLKRLQTRRFSRVAPTHFGIYLDPDRHLPAVEEALDTVEAWAEDVMSTDPSLEELQQQITDWGYRWSVSQGVSSDVIQVHEVVNPYWISATGIYRYWRQFR